MSKTLAGILLVLLFSTANSREAVECAIRVFQQDAQSKDVLLWSDTLTVAKGLATSGNTLAFSTEILCDSIDSSGVDLSLHVVTYGGTPFSAARTFSVEYGLPAKIENIIVKNNGIYSVECRPLRRVSYDTTNCPFNPSVTDGFDISPSANFDLHYVENSFGSFYWTAARELLESKYRLFQKHFNLTLPGKYGLYLLPCPTDGVIWDTRFGVSIDAARSTAYLLYALEHNSVDAVVVCQLAALRTHGYAPTVLSEGWASYLSFPMLDSKRMLAEGKIPSLDSLLDTRAFFRLPPLVGDRCAATFTKYIIDAWGIDIFKRLYHQSSDLSLKSDIATLYGKSIAALDDEWQNYIDTSSIHLVQLRAAAVETEMLLQYQSMLETAREMIRISKSREDSLMSLPYLERACLFSGDYYGAANARATLLSMDSTRTTSRMTLGAYRMMSGQYDSAGIDFKAAVAQNPSDKIAAFNLALWHIHKDSDTARARELLTGAGTETAEGATMYESRVQLAELLKQSSNVEDRRHARELFQQGVNGLLVQFQANMASSSTMLWLGAGYLGLGDTPAAGDFLNSALMLESRPYYQGLIYLYLGKIADHLGDHTGAKAWYGRVLNILSADYHQREARWLIDHPWSQGK